MSAGGPAPAPGRPAATLPPVSAPWNITALRSTLYLRGWPGVRTCAMNSFTTRVPHLTAIGGARAGFTMSARCMSMMRSSVRSGHAQMSGCARTRASHTASSEKCWHMSVDSTSDTTSSFTCTAAVARSRAAGPTTPVPIAQNMPAHERTSRSAARPGACIAGEEMRAL